MTKTIRKLFWVWNFDKEEAWLNQMSAMGWQLIDVGFMRYTFQKGAPGEYIYRLEMLENMPSHVNSADYIHFIEETGAEKIGSLLRWVYFRKKAEDGGFDLFSDIDSRIQHLNRILLLAGILGLLQLINAINLLCRQNNADNSIFGILCLALFILIGFGFFRLYAKRRRLQKEKILHE